MGNYGILSREKSTYTTRDKIGKQPSYWYQGIGRITAIIKTEFSNFISRVLASGGIIEDSDYAESVFDTVGEASLVLIPSAYKAGVLYSILPQNGTGDFNVSRNSVATRLNSNGLIEEVGSNVPRIDYTNGTPVLLTEPQRTNLVTYNNDLTNPNWASGNILKVANDTTSPNGNLDASKATVTLVSDSHFFQQAFSIGENDVTISAYVKNIDANFIQITNAGNVNAYANFDIQNGTLGTKGSAMYNQKIESLPNDWYRISVTVNNTGFPITYMRFYFITSASSPFNEAFLPVSSISLNVWGVQCEIGNSQTSVIPTEGSSATRLLEDVTVAPPLGITEIIETIDGVEQTPITVIPPTYTAPFGNINKIIMNS